MGQRYSLADKNRVDTATLSGGNWNPSYPLSRVQDRNLAYSARTVDLDSSSGVMVIDFGQSTYNRLWALLDTNATSSTEVRIEASQDPSFTTLVYDTDFFNFFDSINSTYDTPWEDPNWWMGTPTEEDLDGWKRTLYHVSDSNVTARYNRITVRDTENPAGYFRIPRLWIGPLWQFNINPSYGVSLAFESNTLVDRSMDNVEFFDERTPNRVIRFSLDHLLETEAFTKALEFVRRNDVHKEVIFIPDYEDPLMKFRSSIYGRMRTLQSLENIAFDLYSMGFEIQELI